MKRKAVTFTKAQIEQFHLMIDICYTTEDVVEKCKEINRFIKAAWELYFWDGDYSKCEKMCKETWRYGSSRIAWLKENGYIVA